MNSTRGTQVVFRLSVLTKTTPLEPSYVPRSGTVSMDRPRATAVSRPQASPCPRPRLLQLWRRLDSHLQFDRRRCLPRHLVVLLLPHHSPASPRTLPALRRPARLRALDLRPHLVFRIRWAASGQKNKRLLLALDPTCHSDRFRVLAVS